MKMHLCGDCFAIALEDGAREVKSATIMYGTGCDTHPTLIAATHVVEVEDGAAVRVGESARRELAVDTPPAPGEIPASVGPLTQLAAMLLASWSRGEEQKADGNAITHAVKAARQLLAETGGQ